MWLMSLSSKLSRVSFRKSFILIIVCLSVLLMSWESQKIDAALLETAIPDESIRLRILAHSDSPQDQAIKMLVRDRVVEQMNSWSTEASSLEEARTIVQTNMNVLNLAVADVLEENGQLYTYNVQLSQVEFPTKAYGGIVYPGGQYEALLITLGEAKGRNWWCVLFPPLCFTDILAGEATAKAQVASTQQLDVKTEDDIVVEQVVEGEVTETEVEVSFFLVDVWQWFKGLFA